MAHQFRRGLRIAGVVSERGTSSTPTMTNAQICEAQAKITRTRRLATNTPAERVIEALLEDRGKQLFGQLTRRLHRLMMVSLPD